MLHKVGVEDNISFYANKGGKSDLILNIVFHDSFEANLLKHLSSVSEGAKLDKEMNDPNSPLGENLSKNITLDDCFKEFRKEELLDEDNKWYCNKCKEHVQATKQLEIFKAPPIIVINLKRFKTGKQRSSYMSMFSGGGGSKIDQEIDFPLEGLDMSKYVQSKENGD